MRAPATPAAFVDAITQSPGADSPGSGSTETDADDLIRYERAAARLGTTPGTLRAMVSRGVVPHIRMGKRMVRFSLRDLDRWVDERKRGAK